MDIHQLIEEEAGGDSNHDRNYAAALMAAYNRFNGMGLADLQAAQAQARGAYTGHGDHSEVAEPMVLMELIKEALESEGG